jgi:hypothetical protein
MIRGEFRAPHSMTPDELGDSLARLVWESFSDFVAEGDSITLSDLLTTTAGAVLPEHHATEEALIFFMWAHTRGTQLAFIGKGQEQLVRRGLDVMHGAIFDDMAFNGTPTSHLPIFEQRVSARYAEYSAAADVSDTRLGQAVVRHLTGNPDFTGRVAQVIAERAIEVSKPLRDFLEDVELIG